MFFSLFLILISFFSQTLMPLKAAQGKSIGLLSKASQRSFQTKIIENKKILNSKLKAYKKINKSALLWDIPLKQLILARLSSEEAQKRYKKALDYLFFEKIRVDSQLKEAYSYMNKAFISRTFIKIFKNPSKLNFSKASQTIAEAKDLIKADLDEYLSYFSKSETKQTVVFQEEYEGFITSERLIQEEYGFNSLNFIKHNYLKYPDYHYDT